MVSPRLIVATLAAPAPASAATVSAAGATLAVSAAPGEANNLTLTRSAGTVD